MVCAMGDRKPRAEFHVALLEAMEVQTELIKTPCHQAWEEGADRIGFFCLFPAFFPTLKKHCEHEDNIIISTFSEE